MWYVSQGVGGWFRVGGEARRGRLYRFSRLGGICHWSVFKSIIIDNEIAEHGGCLPNMVMT